MILKKKMINLLLQLEEEVALVTQDLNLQQIERLKNLQKEAEVRNFGFIYN
tara:strand:- start:169 stop:321 length:153 start_codon:yes stop_codon:yes gene_type:complete